MEKIWKQVFSEEITSFEFDLTKFSLLELDTIFQLIPNETDDLELLNLSEEILEIFAKKLLSHSKENIYKLRLRVFKKFSFFILQRDMTEVDRFIKPFAENFQLSEEMALLIQEIISAEDKLNTYDAFWKIWEHFYPKVLEVSVNTNNYYLNKTLRNYLLAWSWWKETAKDWRSLKEREKIFYKKIVRDIGHLPVVLDSISQLLNQIGSKFLDDGIFWVSDLIEKNQNSKLGLNTVYYLEIIVRKFAYLNRSKIKYDLKLKNKVLIILNYLISRNSVNAYLLREDLI